MSDANDLDDLLAQLEEIGTPAVPVGPARLVLATDWTDAAPAYALLRAFRAIVPPHMPVQFVFAVPHEANEEDAKCVHVLLDGLDADGVISGLEVVSFEEAATLPYDTAVVPQGEAGGLLAQVAGMIVRMHDLVRRFERSANDDTVNRGDLDALAARLSGFSS